MTFAVTGKSVADLAVNDKLLAWVSADGHGENFVSLTDGLTTSANLPTVTEIDQVSVDDPAGDGAGDNAGPYHVFLRAAATDLVNAPSKKAPWMDQGVVVVTATG